MTTTEIGLGGYVSRAQSSPRRGLDMFVRRCSLRSELALLSSELDAGVQALSASELDELRAMMAVEVEAVDADAQALRAEVQTESELARTTKPLTVTVSRRAAVALAQEAGRRLARGMYPNTQTLASDAVCAAYGGAR